MQKKSNKYEVYHVRVDGYLADRVEQAKAQIQRGLPDMGLSTSMALRVLISKGCEQVERESAEVSKG